MWPGVVLVLAVLAAYANSFRAPFVFDDGPAIALAADIAGKGGVRAAFRAGPDAGETASGRPLVALTLALNHALGGDDPWGYHALNLLIHATAALLVFSVMRRLIACRGADLLRPGLGSAADEGAARLRPYSFVPFAVAALWALHPLQTQAVTYTVQRAESLAGMLVLLTVYGFLRGAGDDPAGQRPENGEARASALTYNRWLVLSVVACALAMMTKEIAVGAPLIVLLLDRTFVAGSVRDAWNGRRWYYVALASTWIVLGTLVLGTQGRGGTAGFDAGVSSWHYLLTQARAIWGYLALALWPHPLIFDYGTDVVRTAGTAIPPGVALLGLAAASVWGLWRKTWWGFSGVFFFILLAPSSSVMPIASQTVAEHRMYLAALVPLAFGVMACARVLGRRAAAPVVLLTLGCAWLTYQRNETYRSELALWSDTVAKRPQNGRAHHNLGLAELKRGRIEIAATHFATALRLRPDAADSHYNLGLCLAGLGRTAEAMAQYERALAQRPDHAQAHNNLGALLLGRDRPAEARAHLEQAVRLRPALAEAHCNLAAALLRAGDAARAWQSATEALRLRPEFAEAHVHAGNAAADLKRPAEARTHYEAALRLAPANVDARVNLANVLLEAGQLLEAVPHLEGVLRLAPGHLQARRNLAVSLMYLQRPGDAVPHLEELARALPRDPQVAEALREARAASRR